MSAIPLNYQWLNNVGTLPRMVSEALSAARSDRFRHGTIRRPTESVQAIIERHGLEPVSPGSLDHCHFLAAKTVAGAGRLVALLLAPRSPTAIRLRIGPIIVNALERETIRSRPHVAQEVGKTLTPFVADVNASSAVVRVFLPVCRVAAPLHLRPRVHRRRIRKPVNGVPTALSGRYFTAEASAALRASRAEIGAGRHSLSPAFAAAKRLVSRAANNRPAAMLFANRRGRRVHLLTLSRGKDFAIENCGGMK
jgi:hypothetical protein